MIVRHIPSDMLWILVMTTCFGAKQVLWFWQSVCMCLDVCEILDSIFHLGEIKRDNDFKKKSGKSKNNPRVVAQKALHLPYKENVHVNRVSVRDSCTGQSTLLLLLWKHISDSLWVHGQASVSIIIFYDKCIPPKIRWKFDPPFGEAGLLQQEVNMYWRRQTLPLFQHVQCDLKVIKMGC